MLRNILYIIGSILVFFLGIIIYGVVLNLREISLTEAMQIKNVTEVKNPKIIIDRKGYTLNLYSDSLFIKKYHAVFGKNKASKKNSKDDFVTPIGTYKICKIADDEQYYKKLYLNYPNTKDASEALRDKIINKMEFQEILSRIKNGNCPYPNTKLGADIAIQGIGEYNLIFKNLPFVFNWTNGSIAISNESIDELISVINVGTNVTIKN
ncbi:MAG: L,D-transpeptidase [Ignavibacteriae bacterium]|nr:MAG: L,D-transpeptidase [Ignavibacteriota bacterium]